MKWKNIFSLNKKSKVRKKLLEHLEKQNQQLPGEEITGGVLPPIQQSDVGWVKEETSGKAKS